MKKLLPLVFLGILVGVSPVVNAMTERATPRSLSRAVSKSKDAAAKNSRFQKLKSGVSTGKPTCRNTQESKWSCSDWGACENVNGDWIHTRKCTSDPSHKCAAVGVAPTRGACQPSASQKASYEQQVKLNADKARLKWEQDARNAYVISNYELAKTNLSVMERDLPYFEGVTSMQLFQISTDYSEVLGKLKVYADLAAEGKLGEQDAAEVSKIIAAANSILDRFNAIAGTASKLKLDQLQRIQEGQESLRQRTQYQREADTSRNRIDCNSLKNRLMGELAVSGAGGSSNANKSMYDTLLSSGCISQTEYCAAGQRLGASFGGPPLKWPGCQ